ncbi:hypothetical protein IB233_06525 [Comamonas sp. CMM01]|jgi:hypothetical protein|uniref:hypothetical protein n=1 Tax=Comamonas sp. CMM01 TaxID=2769280 RepID=UPI001782ED93|nr:hypothetical protein [Comamonas sp. CMM01]MBD9531266.1 hypothetical protein [Comamonas sp. CMM01]
MLVRIVAQHGRRRSGWDTGSPSLLLQGLTLALVLAVAVACVSDFQLLAGAPPCP